MGRRLQLLVVLCAAGYVGVGVAMGISAGGLSAEAWTAAALAVITLGITAAAALELGHPATALPLLAAGLLAAVAIPPAEAQAAPLVAPALLPLAGAASVHALLAMIQGFEKGKNRHLWVALAGYAVTAPFVLNIVPWPELQNLWALCLWMLAFVSAARHIRSAQSLTQEAAAVRVLWTLFAALALGLVGLALGDSPLTPATCAVVLAEGFRRGAKDLAGQGGFFSPRRTLATLTLATVFGGATFGTLTLGGVAHIPPWVAASVVAAIVLASPTVRAALAALLGRLPLLREGSLEPATKRATELLEGALLLEEAGDALVPLATALPRGSLAVVCVSTDETVVVSDDDVDLRSARLYGPAVERALEASESAIVAATIVERSVREAHLRPLAELIGETMTDLVVPLRNDGKLIGALLAGTPKRGKRRLGRAEDLASFASVLGPRIHVISLLEKGGRRLAELDGQIETVEEQLERKDYEHQRLKEENRVLRADRQGTAPEEIVARSPSMKRLLKALREASQSTAAVLIVGEPGTGRTLVARTIHSQCQQSEGPLVRFGTGGKSSGEQLRALLGKGDRPGLLELADQGSLVIEELCGLSVEAQAALLRALAEGEVCRVDGPGSRRVTIRLLATTGDDVDQAVEQETLSKELRDRLHALTIAVPPLRKRRSDLPALARFFLQKTAHRHGLSTDKLDPEALEALESYDWPGNVRQLRAVVEHGALAAEGARIYRKNLPPLGAPLPSPHPDEGLEGTFSEVERRVLELALERSAGNKSEAARLLDLKRTTFIDRLRKHNLG